MKREENQSNIRAGHGGNAGCNTVDCNMTSSVNGQDEAITTLLTKVVRSRWPRWILASFFDLTLGQ